MRCCGRAVCALLLVLLASSADAAWHRLDSPNFVVVAAASARELRDIAVRFETFREVIARLRGTEVAGRVETGAGGGEAVTPPAEETSLPDTSQTLAVFRKLNDGEERTEGVLQSIECRAGSAVFVVQTSGQTERLAARRMEGVAFITYREDLSGSVSCGPLKEPMRVFVTSRSNAKADGTRDVVAIAFLPKDMP